MSAGKFLHGLFDKVREDADAKSKKFDEQRQQDVAMYQRVLFDPNSSPEQRSRAASEIEKLRNIKGKDGPFSGLANILNTLKGHHSQGGDKEVPGKEAITDYWGRPSLPDQGKGGSPITAGGEKPQDQPRPQGDSNIPPAKKNIAEKGLTKLTHGLGAGLSSLQGQKRTLPPLDPSVFPTASQISEQNAKSKFDNDSKYHENAMTQYRKDLKEAVPGISDEQLDKAVETKFGALAKTGVTGHTFTKKGSVTGDQIPKDAQDMLGNPIDKSKSYDVLENGQGEKQYIPSTVKPDSETDRTAEQPVYNPKTGKFEEFKVHSTSRTHKVTPGASKGKDGGKAPTDSTGKPTGQPGASKGPFGTTSGNRSMGDNIPIRAFGPLQKQSNAISEARNSLVGDTPDKIGGLAGDLQIFRNPESVKRVSEYIKYVNSQMEQESKAVSGGGPVAAIEWYAGLPATVSNLQAKQLRDYSKSLDGGKEDGPEHNFIANYYRLLGTWGGMRAATGASAAKWGFKNLTSEMPTPGPTTSYLEAVTRVKNMANESNVVSKNNPMVAPIDVEKLMKSVRGNGSGGSAIDKEVEEFYKKNPTLKPK